MTESRERRSFSEDYFLHEDFFSALYFHSFWPFFHWLRDWDLKPRQKSQGLSPCVLHCVVRCYSVFTESL